MEIFKHQSLFRVWLRTITILPFIMLLTLPIAAQEEDSKDVNAVTIESGASDQQQSNSAPIASKSPDSGNTAWMLTATALVLFMTLPGLALFYGGLVQSKNVLSVLMHCFTIACLSSIIWVACGYSLALTEGSEWIGGTERVFLNGLTADSLNNDFPESVWIIFQMTFAIITPGLIVGAFVERIKFSAQSKIFLL